ncbi:MAG: outer membrane lipoprotein carrier protein LolA [Prevotella sp.]|nr:outer membrane lipoprotein carrier protein LolA [Prevotella sp.]
MRKIIVMLICLFASVLSIHAQTVTKVRHTKAAKADVVTTGTLTIRKPSYVCISTDNDRDQLIMDGTQFTMTMGGKKHVTDSRKNPQFATFQSVLQAVINGKAIPAGEDLTVTTKNGQQTITITPTGKQRRQMFTSFVLVVDAKTSAFKLLRMNDRSGGYMEYTFKNGK